jgi:hypothetical protein
MGLLDKANANTGGATTAAPVAPTPATAPVSTPAVAPVAAPAKAAAKEKKPKAEKARPKGLPSEFEIAGAMNRTIGAWSNVIVNFGLIAVATVMSISDTNFTTTLLWGGAFLMYLVNVLVIPLRFGRNIGQFVSRTKYVNSSGVSPPKIHAVLNSLLGFLLLLGIFLVFANMGDISDGDTKAITWFSIGCVMIILPIMNRQFKASSPLNQGMFDRLFATYLVKHVPVAGESAGGWMQRLESMGDFGDRLQERQKQREQRASERAAEKAAERATAANAEDAGAEA